MSRLEFCSQYAAIGPHLVQRRFIRHPVDPPALIHDIKAGILQFTVYQGERFAAPAVAALKAAAFLFLNLAPLISSGYPLSRTGTRC